MLSLNCTNEVAYAPPANTVANEPAGGRASSENALIDPRQLVRELKTFKESRPWRSGFELAITLTPFLFLCWLMLAAVEAGLFLLLVLTVPAGLLLLRLFLIQHDCGHGAFLPSRSGNDWLGRALGVLTLTPYDCWRRSHALHHAGTGNLDARGFGDVDTLTVREFDARTRRGKMLYRFYVSIRRGPPCLGRY
jgi:omega-6 fatty acid desaturase (delta-12 desaturase)